MYKRRGVVIGAAFLLAMGCGLATGCGEDGPDRDMPERQPQDTGLALAIDFQGDTDVGGFRFEVRECDGDLVKEETKSLEDLVIPGMIPEFVDGPFDADSRHLFADYFTTIEPGCYDVAVEPVTTSGAPSQDCSPAVATEVFVVNGKTTEILMISQCKGDETGGLDVVAALNHPPSIKSIDYSPSKFVHECEIADVCVTAHTPNSDPLEFEFEQTAGQQLRFPLEVTDPVVEGDRVTSCMRAVPLWNDDYEFKVTVYDMFWQEGQKVRMDDALAEKSRAEMTFQLYSNWDIELECYDQEEDLFYRFDGVREIQRAEGCRPIWPYEFFCSEFHWDETERTCPGGWFQPETVYPLCEDHEGMYDESTAREPRQTIAQ